MKKAIIILTISILCSAQIKNSTGKNTSYIIIYNVITKKKTIEVDSNLNKFLTKLALLESSNNQYAVNPLGYMGKYQFSVSTLSFLGFNLNKKEFLNSSIMQDSALVTYMRYNQRILRKFIAEYTGMVIDGIKINRACILAGAHLTGAGGVIEFFKREGKYNMYDGNGISVAAYMRKFSGINLNKI